MIYYLDEVHPYDDILMGLFSSVEKIEDFLQRGMIKRLVEEGCYNVRMEPIENHPVEDGRIIQKGFKILYDADAVTYPIPEHMKHIKGIKPVTQKAVKNSDILYMYWESTIDPEP